MCVCSSSVEATKENGTQARELEEMRGWWWLCLVYIKQKQRLQVAAPKLEPQAARASESY
jgi:hypothetical protein